MVGLMVRGGGINDASATDGFIEDSSLFDRFCEISGGLLHHTCDKTEKVNLFTFF